MARETIASMSVRLGVDLTDFEKKMKEFQRTFGRLGKQVQDAGTTIGTAFTTAGAAMAAGLGLAVNKAMDFDKQMSRVGAIAGAAGQDLENMRKTALDLGASTSKSATEVAQGMELMAAKGYEANEVIAAMPGVIAAAEASGEDMALVADTVASALNAFQLEAGEASRVADILAKSANTSAAGVEDLQYAFKYAAPIFQSAGYSIEQLAAATGIMADAGMKGEQVGTTLRAAIARLAKPTDEAAATLKQLGVSVTDSTGTFLPFDQIIAQLSTSMYGMSNAQKSAALATIFGLESMTGMLTLIEAGPEKFRALTTELQNSAGASATAAAQMKDNLAGSMQELSGAFETLQISIGSALAPAIRSVADALSGMVNWFNKLSPATQKFIAIGAALTAGLTVLTGVVGFLVAGLGALAAAEWAVILPIAGVVAAVAAAIAILGALVFAVVKAYKENETFRKIVDDTWKAVTDAIKAAWNFIKPVVEEVQKFITEQWIKVKQWFDQNLPIIQKAFENTWNNIKARVLPIVNTIVEIMKWAWPYVKTIIVDTWERVKIIISGTLDTVLGIIKTVMSMIAGDWEGAWQGIKDTLQSIFDSIMSLLGLKKTEFYKAGKGLLDTFVDGIKKAARGVYDAVEDIVQKIRDMLPSSPAKIGPLSDIDKLDFAGPVTDSIFGGLPQVQAAMSHMLTMPEINPLGDIGASAASVGTASNSPMTIIMELDGRQIARYTMDYMGGTFRARGVVT